MTKHIGKQGYKLLLISILAGAIFASFESSATFAQITPEEPILEGGGSGGAGSGGGTNGGRGDCKDVQVDGTRCAAIWCYYTILGGPNTATCKYMRTSGSGTCPQNVSCKP